MGSFDGKRGLIFGVANKNSIAWGIAQALAEEGATLGFSYAGEVLQKRVTPLAGSVGSNFIEECDVTNDAAIDELFAKVGDHFGNIDFLVHSIAFANREDLGGPFIDTPREGFRVALDISAYSLVSVTRAAAPLMKENGGSIVTMTFQASGRVFPGYNVMGTAKAALENEVRQLAWDLGRDNIRINAISAGPVDTLSSRVISGYRDMKRAHADRSPMGRNITHDEVANTALFLCSDMSSGITGEVLHVDTGYNVMGI